MENGYEILALVLIAGFGFLHTLIGITVTLIGKRMDVVVQLLNEISNKLEKSEDE